MKKVIALFAVTVTTLLSTAPSWAMGELFGVALGLKVENLRGWNCKPAGQRNDLRGVECRSSSAIPLRPAFGEFQPQTYRFTEHSEYGICMITGVMYKVPDPENIFDWSERLFSEWQKLPELGQGKLVSTRSLAGVTGYRVVQGVGTDKIGLKAGGRIMRWENLGPENSTLQIEAYDIKPEYRPLSEGPIFESLTSKGYPVTNKVDMALLLLVGDFGASCIF